MLQYTIGAPEHGSFNGGLWIGFSNNDLQPNESPEMYNYLVDDSGLTKCPGCAKDNATQIGSGTGTTGLFRFYNGSAYKTFAKIGTRIYDVASTGYSHFLNTDVTEAGDASNQCSSWVLVGGDLNNTNAGVLYWKLTDAAGTRTVSVYKNSDGAAGNLVAQGSRSGDGEVSLAEQNSSGLTGAVTVAYTGDDTDLASNTLTYAALTAATVVQWASWFGRYFYADEVNLYAGTTGSPTAITFADEDGNPVSWASAPYPKSPVVHKEHLWFIDARAANDGGTRIVFTKTDYYDRLYHSGTDYVSYVNCDKNDGFPLVGLVRLPSDELMAFKNGNNKTYLITGDYQGTAANTLNPRPGPPAGAFSQSAIDVGPDGFVRWCGLSGVWEYRRDVGSRHISRPIDYGLSLVSSANQPKIRVKHTTYQGRLYLVVSYASTGTTNNRCFIADVGRRGRLDQPCWVQRRSWGAADLYVYEDGTLHAGWADTGYVKKLFYGANDDGSAIACLYKTKYFTWVHGVVHALRYLRFGGRTSAGTITITYLGDVASGASGTVDIEQPATGTALGEFLLGTSALVGVEDLLNYGTFDDRPPGGQCFREIQFSFSESSSSAHSIDFLEVTAAPVRRDV